VKNLGSGWMDGGWRWGLCVCGFVVFAREIYPYAMMKKKIDLVSVLWLASSNGDGGSQHELEHMLR
jgi:hypothetical protein